MSEDRVSDLLDPALRGLGVRARVREERVRLLFAELVGPALASLCRAEQLERGSLLIATANSALAHQLQLEAPRLMASLNDALGVNAVRRLRFRAM